MRHSRAFFAFFIGASLFAACQEHVVEDRSGRLLTMAGEEAVGIPDSLDRFTRQLNIADTQLRTGRDGDALKTLALARQTISASKPQEFDDFHRIAGWTAISQLARRSGDPKLAVDASDQAQAALNDVKPVDQRAQYVLSLAFELAELRGTPAAVELLDSGGAWVGEMQNAPLRRRALAAFAMRLLTLDAYEDARSMLRRDPDPAWRTDEFLVLANRFGGVGTSFAASSGGRGGAGGAGGVGGVVGRGFSTGSDADYTTDSADFGKDVRFESVFQKK